jgi:membrane-associated phospholipid phosphatase
MRRALLRVSSLQIANIPDSSIAGAAANANVEATSMGICMFKHCRLAVLIMLFALSRRAEAFTPDTRPLTSTQKNIETLGTGLSIALPLAAGGIAWAKGDRVGIAQLTVEAVLTVGTAYALKNIVREERPNGLGYESFPSETTALSASGSSFLWGRYGWDYGLPAFAVTQFVSYSRVQARQHRWYDTLASSAIGAGYGYILTTPFKKRYNISTTLNASPDSAFLKISYAW